MIPYTISAAACIAAAIAAHSGDDEQLSCALDPARASEACGMFDDMEARCGWQREAFALAYAVIEANTPMFAFLAQFPAVQTDEATGGGFTAWFLILPSGERLMFTGGEDGGYQPAASDETVTVSYYAADGKWDEIVRPDYTWPELTAFVRGFLAGKTS